ncbi:MAG: tellurite resistance TerB family protein [Gammaproteobacteria bacterium]|nr:tellurite resistance TerB family protein [Gammaproteobacteria bacterium]
MDAMRLLGSLMGNSGGIGGQILGSLLGGGQQQQRGGSLGDLLGGLAGGGRQGGGGLGGALGSLLGGGGAQQQSGGGLGALLGGGGGGLGAIAAAALTQFASKSGGSEAGGLLGSLLGGGQPPEQEVASMNQAEVQDGAVLMIRAMCNAAKCDGEIDKDEQQKILSKLGDVDQQELEFVRSELSTPVDVQGFARSIPRGMEQQIYAMSLFGMTLDTQPEAQYLGQLAQAMGLDGQTCNQIHKQLGAPEIFS